MKTKTLLAICLSALACAASARQAHAPVVLKGLDPVMLIQGREVKGSPTLYEAYGGFTYRFASAADKSTFDGDRARYAVQRGGACLHMPSMSGNPDLFLVYAGKIYLAGGEGCLAAVKADPSAFVKDFKAPLKVAVLIFPNVETIDYAGPIEVFGEAGCSTFTVAATSEPIHTCWGEKITPDYTFGNCPSADILVLPGGGVSKLDKGNTTVQWVLRKAPKTPYTLTVCNGAFWLAETGLLDGKSATTTYHNIERLASMYPKVHVVSNQRFVDNGSLITAGGLSAGIDGALHVVERALGHDTAKEVALSMEYDWRPDAPFVRGDLADKYIQRAGHFDLPSGVKASDSVSEGDANSWEEKYEVRSAGPSGEEIMESVKRTLNAAKWTMTSSKAGNGYFETDWIFKGDDGLPWTAVYTLQRDPADKGKFTGHSLLKRE